ncbi:MAG: DUF2334 domain-containing protein [Methanococci archaeon]|nr:DUF2334 domain-containing protein [Methanococci archaeon]
MKNKRFKKFYFYPILILFLILMMFLFSSPFEQKNIGDKNDEKPIILIHDVSPVYFKDLKEIVRIIDKHHFQNRTYLFIIVNHANNHNLKNYPKFVNYLHELEKEGYHIEFHAYNHIGDEFNCNKTVAEEKLNLSFKIMKECKFNVSKIKYFIPPRYKISKDAEEVFLNRNISIILKTTLITPKNESIIEYNIVNREYTWYLPKTLLIIVEPISIIDYKICTMEGKRYFLSIHPKAINYGGGLEFLDHFLNETR